MGSNLSSFKQDYLVFNSLFVFFNSFKSSRLVINLFIFHFLEQVLLIFLFFYSPLYLELGWSLFAPYLLICWRSILFLRKTCITNTNIWNHQNWRISDRMPIVMRASLRFQMLRNIKSKKKKRSE